MENEHKKREISDFCLYNSKSFYKNKIFTVKYSAEFF